MADDLEERLKSDARAFEGLTSLIPAKHYYGEDTSDQWQRRKQTKEQKREAKRAKLDPANQKSAKDVMDENERKRKRELEGEDEVSDIDAPGKEKPREGLKVTGKKAKKQKLNDGTAGAKENAEKDEDEPSEKQTKAEKRKEKREKKKEKKIKQQEKAEARKARKEAANVPEAEDEEQPHNDAEMADEDGAAAQDIDEIDVSGIVEDSNPAEPESSASPSPPPESPASGFPSASSSSTSIVPPASADHIKQEPLPTFDPSAAPSDSSATAADPSAPPKERAPKLPKIDPELLRARLTARIDALRAARKADGIDGKPAKNRAELLEARRRKEEARRAHKKELRAKAKEDEQRSAAERELARLRGSGSPLSVDIFSPRSPERVNNFSFGRVAFNTGEELDNTMSGVRSVGKKKGPQDPKTALEAAKKKQARFEGLDEAKKADIAEKDAWLNAKKRAHGERVRDDVSLLKKTLKRKEKQKTKSEKAWGERIEGVKKGQEARQKKREENLRKRKEEKGSKGSKGKGKGKKPKGRPGFEGSFRSKAK